MLSKLTALLLLAAPSYAAESNQGVIALTSDNTVVFRGVVNGSSVATAQVKLAEQINKRGKKPYPLYLVLDTPGGGISAGEDFIQFAKRVRNLQTITIFAASMGSAIVEALPGKRYVTENGVLMFHRAKGSFDGQFEDGEVESELALIKTVVRFMEQRNADRLGLTLADYKSKVINELWAHSKDAVVQGMVDEVVTLDCSMELIESRVHVINEGLFGGTDLMFSGCPLIRSPIPQVKIEPIIEGLPE
jgi:ATP-dependent protease ClpP protease subunit